jgi:uncharacterized protein (UPF0305 family)
VTGDLVREIRRLLKVADLQKALESRSVADLQAVERLLDRRVNVRPVGRKRKYLEAYTDSVLSTIRAEMKDLKARRERCGPKSAIRSFIVRVAIEAKGASEPARRAAEVAKLTNELFKVYEAGRRR